MGFVEDMASAAQSGAQVLSIEYLTLTPWSHAYEPTAGKGYCAVYVEMARLAGRSGAPAGGSRRAGCVHDCSTGKRRDAREQEEFLTPCPREIEHYLRRTGSHKAGHGLWL